LKTQPTSYRTILDTLPLGPDGLVLSLETSPTGDDQETYIALRTTDEDICLYLRVDWNQSAVTITKCIDGEWLEKISSCARIHKAATSVSLAIRQSFISISVGGERILDWPLAVPFEKIASLQGSGFWSLDLSSAYDMKLPPEVFPELPLANNLIATAQPDLIFDIGMHNGDDSDYYLKKGFRVIAIEANPTLCALGAARFKDAVESKRLIICNIGIAPVRGELSFYINNDITEWSSFDCDIASRGHAVTEIKIATSPPIDFFAAFGVPYYCKIDIEGFDRLVVDTICDLKVKPNYVSFENGAARDFEVLAEAGYGAFQLVEQSCIPKIKLPNPSLEGDTIEHSFRSGSSGPFGRDLMGAWLGVEETRSMLERHHHELSARSERGYDWWDLHAFYQDKPRILR
jgi:FkbM family methyltransferase